MYYSHCSVFLFQGDGTNLLVLLVRVAVLAFFCSYRVCLLLNTLIACASTPLSTTPDVVSNDSKDKGNIMSFGFTGKVSVASVFLLFGMWCAVTLFPVGLDNRVS